MHFVARKCVVLLADFCVVYFTIYSVSFSGIFSKWLTTHTYVFNGNN